MLDEAMLYTEAVDRDDERRHRGEGQDDEDRRVILARRQRFIALALAGLEGTAGACAARPEPESTSPESADASPSADSEGPPEGVDPIDKPPPRPPKELDPPRRKWTLPQACLRIDLPDDEAP